MMKKNLLWILALGVAMVGCSENDPIEQPEGDLVPIEASTTVMSIEAGVTPRSPFLGIGPNPSNLLAQVIATKVSGDYTTLYTDGTMNFEDGTKEEYASVVSGYPNYYPADNSYIYLAGFYPSTGWSKTTETTPSGGNLSSFTYTIDGKTDVMAAPEEESRKDDALGVGLSSADIPNLAFVHLLTRLDIAIIAETGAPAAWGAIDKIELINAKGTAPIKKVSYTPQGGVIASVPTTPPPTTPEVLGFYVCTPATATAPTVPATFSDTPYAGTTSIPTTSTFVAYTMMAPINLDGTNDDVTLKVYVDNGKLGAAGNKYEEVKVKLPSTPTATPAAPKYTAGLYYTITLTFKATLIEATATVAQWTSGGEGGATIQ